jgi:pyruvate formate-lyase activating enzyme-like uncharacterized protein
VAKIKRMEKGSAFTHSLPDGCKLCREGAKMVLLVTGKCPRRCCYCPLSTEKKGRDVFFANERRINVISEMLDEARLMDAKGTGMTGGDPLAAISRTDECIRALKKEFGDGHHIHLYTSTTNRAAIKRVARAGLDEIRFHPPMAIWRRLEESAYASAVSFSKGEGLSVGLEIPVLPGREEDLQAAVAFADERGLDFVNLNELEFSETNWRALRRIGYDVKTDISSAVMGSEALGRKLLKNEASVPLHYCSSAFKDGIQLRRRIMRRGKNVKKPHEILTEDGTLLKGVIETDHISATTAWLLNEFEIPGRFVWSDHEKDRLEVAPWILEEIAAELPYESYIVEEYPTADRLEVERRPLKRR